MRKSLIVAGLFAALSVLAGCDDVVKGVARTIVENDEKERAQAQAQPSAQPMQPVQPVGQEQYYPVNGAGAVQQPVVIKPPVVQQVIVEEPPPAYTTDQDLGSEIYYVSTDRDGYIYMRSSPNTNAKKIARLDDGTPVTLISCPGNTVIRKDRAAYNETGKWCKVRAKGYIGYVFDRYLVW